MKVSAVAKQLQVSSDTVRYYSRIGLVTPEKDSNGYKDYRSADIARLQFALSARRVGFSLADIQSLLAMSSHGEAPCPKAREVIGGNIDKLRASIAESQQLLTRMEQAQRAWREMPDCPPSGDQLCSLIQGWQGGESTIADTVLGEG